MCWQTTAHALVEAAVSYAGQEGHCINVAEVGGVGRRAAFLRMPGPAFDSVDIAINRCTAMNFGLPISEKGQRIGGIGRSGASGQQDEEMAGRALAHVQEQ